MDHISKYTNKDVSMEKVNRNTIISFIIGVIVGLFVFWLWSATMNQLQVRNTEETNLEYSTEVSEDTTPQDTETSDIINTPAPQLRSDAIVVQNQAAGSQVVVTRAVFDESGWVVVHEGNGEQIGNALGALRFDEGEHSGVVELLRATEEGEVYWAVLYRDNGDKEFSLETDFPFIREGNQPVLTTFRAL